MSKLYYGAHSYMGLGFSYDSPCWVAYGFGSKKGRDEWVAGNPQLKEAVSRQIAYKIARIPVGRPIELAYDNQLVIDFGRV